GSRFALYSRIGGQNYFFHFSLSYPGYQAAGPQVLRTNPVQGRQSAVQNVRDTVVTAGLFNHCDVAWFFHHTDDPLAAGRARAIDAWVNIGDVVAGGAEQQPCLELAYCVGQRSGVFRARAEDVESEPLRALGANPWEFAQLFDQPRH